jgi:hypothetical protein
MLSDMTAGELQFAYAIQNNWGIMFNAFAAGGKVNYDRYIEKGSGTYAEVAGGYFNSLNKGDFWMAEVYGGIGKGWVNSTYDLHDFSEIGFTKYFIQPSIGYKSRNFEFAFTSRLGLVNWKVKNQLISNGDNLEQLDVINRNPSFFVFEPGLMVRGGGKNVKGQLGFTICRAKWDVAGFTEPFTINLGLSFSFHMRKAVN